MSASLRLKRPISETKGMAGGFLVGAYEKVLKGCRRVTLSITSRDAMTSQWSAIFTKCVKRTQKTQ